MVESVLLSEGDVVKFHGQKWNVYFTINHKPSTHAAIQKEDGITLSVDTTRDDVKVLIEHITAPQIDNNNKSGEKDMDSKVFYKTVQETPLLMKGAIIGPDYKPLSDLWNTKEDITIPIYSPEAVKDNPKWFTRVYEAQVDGRTVYVDKTTARKLLEESVELKAKKNK